MQLCVFLENDEEDSLRPQKSACKQPLSFLRPR